MIYISLAYLGSSNLKESIRILYENGFKNIELSGNFDYYEGLESDLLDLQTKHNLRYICHNHFPPPQKPFVLNLASLNDVIYKDTLAHLKKVIKFSRKLNAQAVGFHAGFFVDIANEEIGNDLDGRALFDREKSIKRFCQGFNELKNIAGSLELYIENNIISHANLKAFDNENPLMLTSYNEFIELKKMVNFNLLLDIGHLKVSATSLGLDFEDELDKMISVSSYLHCSDNDGLSDQNKPLSANSVICQQLKNRLLDDKIITLEVEGGIKYIKNSYKLLMGM